MSFADVEARTTASVFARLANVQASFVHAGESEPVVVTGVFDAAAAVVDEFGAVAGRPVLQLRAGVAPLAAEGDAVTITSLAQGSAALGAYTVRAVLPQAEGGWRRVVLAKG